ncbi:class I tRNA ligase family protein, partial [Staphylococcus saprophyticus]|uniref:class I tRNA ligase family protein n=1 Tax=Staphylococcus saprophyticus TaxID=29385 RepID=UPI0021B47FB3
MKPKYNPTQLHSPPYHQSLNTPYFKTKHHQSKQTYTILIPPPNLTPKLHLPHASHTTLQHIFTPIKPMQGYHTL